MQLSLAAISFLAAVLPTATAAPANSTMGSAGGMKASFTEYGSGDIMGSQNCATATNACGAPGGGFTAALSQKQFGVGPGAGAGPACGQCWALTIESDFSGQTVQHKSVKVRVNNLCPIDGNPVCNVPNQYGSDVHFDICKDTGAAGAFFPNGGGAGLGTAVQVPC